ncbi:ferric iron reductase protein FhuF [Roseomonas rosea]|uniref:Ferric iron reductase protein FhuF n=1 Tax=Muricoccus roseus TaxID=198092 RepID=A0A1M6FQY1_9PROT|nr:siderophore-iron reductase FhuF [Roseomonas rosea]SHJ00066.1 ferric iron reductase protein FhuF [Roseomonas rosea]
MLDELLSRFALTYPDQPDRRAVASIWSKWHFAAVMPPVLAASLCLDHALPVPLDGVDVLLDPQGKTIGIRPAAAGEAHPTEDPFTRFAPLVFGHLEPLIEALAQNGRGAPRLFWSNVGTLFENLLQRLQHGGQAPALAQGEALLRTRVWPGGRPNLLFEPVRHANPADPSTRMRRVCCLRYLIPSLPACASCPLARQESPLG